MSDNIYNAIGAFPLEGILEAYSPYGNGHINDTYILTFKQPAGSVNYILQRINHNVFKNPEAVMENIMGITRHLKAKIIAAGGDYKRETLNVIPAKDGLAFYRDDCGSYWRVYDFIRDATSHQSVERPEDFYNSALAFGGFVRLLADYPAATLHETIPNFHNTPARMQRFNRRWKPM